MTKPLHKVILPSEVPSVGNPPQPDPEPAVIDNSPTKLDDRAQKALDTYVGK